MLRKLLILAVAGAAIAAPVAGAHAGASKPVWSSFPRGDLLVTFSGTGGGDYRYHNPPAGTAASCRTPDTSYSETDAYSWRDTFVVGPAGGTSDAPVGQLAGTGQLTGTAKLGPCGASAASTSTCTQSLRPPSSQGDGDLTYPDVTVVLSGRLVTIGALSELLGGSSPTCTGDGPDEEFPQHAPATVHHRERPARTKRVNYNTSAAPFSRSQRAGSRHPGRRDSSRPQKRGE